MWNTEQLALERPTLRRAIMMVAVAALLAYAVAGHHGRWNWKDIASLILAIASGAAAAVVSSHADSVLYRSSSARAKRWARGAIVLSTTAGSVSGIALARAGSVAIAAVVAGFLLGFLAVAAFLYPLRAVRTENANKSS